MPFLCTEVLSVRGEQFLSPQAGGGPRGHRALFGSGQRDSRLKLCRGWRITPQPKAEELSQTDSSIAAGLRHQRR